MANLKEIGEICRGCLATDRTLTPIDSYYHIYHKIFKDSFKEDYEQGIPLMCWECNASMKNFEKFRNKLLEADLFFSSFSTEFQIKPLSTLTTTINNVIDVEYNEEDIKHDSVSDDDKNYVKIDINLKEEPLDYESTYNCDDNHEQLDSNDLPQCNDYVKVKLEPVETVKAIEHKTKVKGKVKSEKEVMKQNCKVIYLNKDNVKTYERIRVDDKEMAYWREQEKTRRRYKKTVFKCEICISAFSKEKLYLEHVKKYHAELSRKYVCDICKKRFATKCCIYRHMKGHYTKYKCKLCDFQCLHYNKIEYHRLRSHKKSVECRKCRMQFTQFPEFYKHYRELHKYFTCDYCGKNKSSKKRLIEHMWLSHSQHRCEACNKSYKSYSGWFEHNRFYHTKSAREQCYCVECNLQFDNVALYKRHIHESVKHKKKKEIPCTACDRVFDKRCRMLDHYNYFHLKKTKHYCEPCDKYYINASRLRQHKLYAHDKVPRVKNKLCPYCNRGFSKNAFLDNHIRTHTGERPFQCEYCSLAFTQKQALNAHTRRLHNK